MQNRKRKNRHSKSRNRLRIESLEPRRLLAFGDLTEVSNIRPSEYFEPQSRDDFGAAIASVGDLNADGLNDLVVGDPEDQSVWVLFMNDNGAARDVRYLANGQMDFGGSLQAGDDFGAAVAGIGDVDGNGVRDIAVGAPGDSNDQGAVWILLLDEYGSVKQHAKIPAPAGLGNGARFGESLAFVGDGQSIELAVGAPFAGRNPDNGNTPGEGAVSIIAIHADLTASERTRLSSSDQLPLSPADLFGTSLASKRNTDGTFELLVGAIGHDQLTGKVWHLKLDESAKITSVRGIGKDDGGPNLAVADLFGSAVAFHSPIVGTDSIFVGASNGHESLDAQGDRTGRIHVFSASGEFDAGSQIDTTLINIVAGAKFGRSIAFTDIQPDGRIELVAGIDITNNEDPLADNQVGDLLVLSLNDSMNVAGHFSFVDRQTWTPQLNESHIGIGAAMMADVNRDGHQDYVVSDAAKLWILFRDAQGNTIGQRIIGEGAGGIEGQFHPSRIAPLGDVNGDGAIDIAVVDTTIFGESSLWILMLNREGSVSHQIRSTLPSDSRYLSVTTAGDLNADGVNDVITTHSSGDENVARVVFLNRDGQERSTLTLPAAYKLLIAPGDLDGDGADDLIGLDDRQADSILLNRNGTVKEARPITQFNANPLQAAGVGDVDGNGVPDFLTRNLVSLTTGLVSNEITLMPQGKLHYVDIPGKQILGSQWSEDSTVLLTGATIVSQEQFVSSSVQSLAFTRGETDFGDAPDTLQGNGPGDYNTLRVHNGPSHRVDERLKLGSLVSGGKPAAPSRLADGDDFDDVPLGDDEDGLIDRIADLSLFRGQTPAVELSVTNQTDRTAMLYGWIDYNGNGVFENSDTGADERASVSIPAGFSGTQSLAFPMVPNDAVGSTYARFRLSTDDTLGGSPDGPLSDGEVEDYPVQIASVEQVPQIVNDHSPQEANPVRFAGAGDNVFYFTPSSELWVTSKAGGETSMLSSLKAFNNPVAMNGILYFENGQGNDTEGIWRSDGTVAGTFAIAPDHKGLRELVVFQNRLYFWANTGPNAQDSAAGLWQSSGNAGDFSRIERVFNETHHQFTNVAMMAVWNDTLYLAADGTDASGQQKFSAVWRLSGGLPQLVEEVNPNKIASFTFIHMTATDHGIYLVTRDSVGAQTLSLIGEGGGLQHVSNLLGDLTTNVVTLGDFIYFAIRDNTTSETRLYRSDGSSLRTDVLPGSPALNPFGTLSDGLVVAGDHVYYVSRDGQLVSVDREGNVSTIVGDVSSFGRRVALQDSLYFASSSGGQGSELWVTDGNADSTRRVFDLFPGDQDGVSSSAVIANVDGSIYFSGNDGRTGFQPWVLTAANPATISIGDVSRAEGSGTGLTNFEFTVSLAGSVPEGTTVTYRVQSEGLTQGSSASGQDYFSGTSGSGEGESIFENSITFAGLDGETQSIFVPISADDIVENNEHFTVEITSVSTAGVLIDKAIGRGTIINDDQATVSITSNVAAVKEGDSGRLVYPFTVTIDRQTEDPIQVDFATVNQSARSSDGFGTDRDFVHRTGTLNLGGTHGLSQTFEIEVHGDRFIEPDESFHVELSNLRAGDLDVSVSDNRETAVIQNDDFPVGQDFGDAPESYGVFLSAGGARHTAIGPMLGERRDADFNGQPSEGADGDDLDSIAANDEDGVRFLSALVSDDAATSAASVVVTASEPAKLDAWIDFDRDGSWYSDHDQIFASLDLTEGDNTLTFDVPAGLTPGPTYARFRLSVEGDLDPLGSIGNGEVEDYRIDIEGPDDRRPIVSAAPDETVDLVQESDDVVVRAADGEELFRADAGAIDAIVLEGSAGNETFRVARIDAGEGPSVGVRGAAGDDTLWLTGSEQRLTLVATSGNAGHEDIETFDIRGDGPNELLADPQGIAGATDSRNQATIFAGASDRVDLAGDWQIAGTSVIDGTFFRVLESGNVTIHLSGPTDWTNPLDPLDVNGNGTVEPLDALVIINELSRRSFIDDQNRLPTAASITEFGFFFDVLGSEVLTPLAALRIINALSRQPSPEGEAAPPIVSSPSQEPSRREASGLREDREILEGDQSGYDPFSVAVPNASALDRRVRWTAYRISNRATKETAEPRTSADLSHFLTLDLGNDLKS